MSLVLDGDGAADWEAGRPEAESTVTTGHGRDQMQVQEHIADKEARTNFVVGMVLLSIVVLLAAVRTLAL